MMIEKNNYFLNIGIYDDIYDLLNINEGDKYFIYFNFLISN